MYKTLQWKPHLENLYSWRVSTFQSHKPFATANKGKKKPPECMNAETLLAVGTRMNGDRGRLIWVEVDRGGLLDLDLYPLAEWRNLKTFEMHLSYCLGKRIAIYNICFRILSFILSYEDWTATKAMRTFWMWIIIDLGSATPILCRCSRNL